ncbi:hypothetical protein AB6887_07540 [Carnobacterium divergens]|uniref:Uncharacterized protein n=1 Tax=Carnobacterium divergens TaxID=2748 RepID=A0A7Z8G3E7_CARDV|nr:hypothetical protein [Carnobacterium divergens]TFI71236.1 hypothetical protein CKN58_09305 [Carnobacterium divergens]TFI75878.1 hypothetical protein CKN85_09360 [Carnobacterium divergens]TFI81750.1 hypothetical protein CKN56_09385 [Carnobacterium divergens]TFI94059.1 hypothetical protein CKN64_09325 [Carnobacterium divergens]TFJ10339.1 hypothetical protein CKN60_09355 [Carnobacterium divergens]
MTNLSALLDILKKINENYEKKILTNESITEETENIEEIKDLNIQFQDKLNEFEKINLNSPKEVSTFLVEIHLLLGEYEWQYEQIHELIRHSITDLYSRYDHDDD